MSEQIVVKPLNSPDVEAEIEREKNGIASKSEYYLDVVPLDMAVIHETGPVGGIDPEDSSMEKPAAKVEQQNETIVLEMKTEYFVDVIPNDMAVVNKTSPVGGIDPEDTSMKG
jgi:hypothetical protein